MKKIAIITPFLAQGGLEKVAVTGANYLSNKYDITLIVFDTFKVDYSFDGNIIDLKVPFYNKNSFMKLLNLFKIILKLRIIKKTKNFDLIITHGELANISTTFSGNGKHIVVIHENRFAKHTKKIQSKIFDFFAQNIYQKAIKIVTVSEGIRQEFIKRFSLEKNMICTIYNPINLSHIYEQSNSKIERYSQLYKNFDIISSVGRLTKAKGHYNLLHIFSNYNSQGQYKLIILGDGELKSELFNHSIALGLKTYSIFEKQEYHEQYDVYFLGFDTNPYNHIKHSKLFIMSSLWEGFGNTLVESMACSTPVLSTDCQSGPKEIISPDLKNNIEKLTYGKYGFLLPRFSSSSKLSNDEIKLWTESLNAILNNSQQLKKYSHTGKIRAKNFDINNIMQQWDKSIEAILNEKKES